jgi:CheY-like chemotaxis protein
MPEDPRPHILCVDDEINVLEGLGRTLRNLFVVETAVGGTEGLEAMRAKGPFVVVVSDLRMPKMNGVEFLSRAVKFPPIRCACCSPDKRTWRRPSAPSTKEIFSGF